MEINYIAIVACAVVAMVLGFVWFGPLFGKQWLQIIGATEGDLARRKEMQKAAMPLYVIQFAVVLVEAYILAHFINGWAAASGIETAVWLWLGFVVPTLAAAVMWTNEQNNAKIARFGIQAGYHLVLLIIFGFILQTMG